MGSSLQAIDSSKMNSKAAQYSYNQPGAVYSGLAIEFNMSGVCQDSNSNGMPDRFDKFYFGDMSVSGSDDNDGDGMNNAEEIRCGTDPTDSRSVLKLEDIGGASTNKMVLNWQCIPWQRYNVKSSASIFPGTWSNVNQTSLYGKANGIGCYTATVNAAQRAFFCVAVP